MDLAPPIMATHSGIDELLSSLEREGRLVHLVAQQAQNGQVAPIARPLPSSITHCLPDDGLWTHQAEAIDLLRGGESVVLTTGTGSGKSLCYQIPIAESVVNGIRAGTSLAIFPTKALAHDQRRRFEQMKIPGMVTATYDGDASRQQRTWARSHANVLLTNPEMLHSGILPNHRRWATFFRRLDFVVVDELHALRGVFGSHTGHLLRRLLRIAERYGAQPTFAFTSATVGSPGELATALTSLPVTVVDRDASPQTARRVALVQPALVDQHRGRHQSPATEAIRIVADLVSRGRKVIGFCASRSQTERVALGVDRALPPHLQGTVRAYRAGYLAEERREIEGDLADGTLNAVLTTSALELGVDIGGLDDVVLCGFPGTVASMWQQIGRTGRWGQGNAAPDSGVEVESLAVVIAADDQLDQWFVHHPTELFSRPPEPVVVNLTNPGIRDPHLACAAHELPLGLTDDQWWDDLDDGVLAGVRADNLGIEFDHFQLPRAVWRGQGVPFQRVNLRSASFGQVRILNEDRQLIGTVETARAATVVYPGAVYLHRGAPWRVLSLDLEAREAIVTPDPGTTWTRPRSTTSVTVTTVGSTERVGTATVNVGAVAVTQQVSAYVESPNSFDSRARDHQSDRDPSSGSENPLSVTHELTLPPQVLETTAIWYEWDSDRLAMVGLDEERLLGAMHALEHAAIGILPLFAICDRWDVGGVSYSHSPHRDQPTFFIYDGYPGGAGIAELTFGRADEHLAATAAVIDRCICTGGCPSCVQSPKCGNNNESLDKWAALVAASTALEGLEPF